MKKFMRIALVFALAGATLMYTGCTKDYSGDISDLNKKVSEQASALSALQTQVAAAQSSASEALSSAQNALKEAQAAAKAAEAANNDAEVAALTTKIATIEGNIADLQAKVEALNGLEAKLNEVADQLKKDVNAKVDAALEEIQKELEKAIAQVEGNFSVTAPIPYEVLVSYASDVWSPTTSKADEKKFAVLTAAFPELAEIKKGDVIEMYGKLPFTVSPASLELDDTYSFSLVATDGSDSHVALGNPTEGFDLKSTAGVWTVDVMSPAFNEYGIPTYAERLALVIEDANGNAAQTQFVYAVGCHLGAAGVSTFTLNTPSEVEAQYQNPNSFIGNTIYLSYCGVTDVVEGSAPLYENYFLIEATDEALVEKYGVSIDGSEVTIENGPEAGEEPFVVIPFRITAVGVNGKVSQKPFTLKLTAASIATNAELAAKEVILGYNKAKESHDVAVKYDVADFGFSALEWKTVFEALHAGNNITATYFDANGKHSVRTTNSIKFYDANGEYNGNDYKEVKAFGFNVDSKSVAPNTYTIEITDGAVFCGEGELVVKNPETCPVKLIDALCKDGILQIVGTVTEDGFITYGLTNALVYNPNEARIIDNSFVDEDHIYDEDPNWVADQTFKVKADKKNLYKVRNFSVKFGWFTNEANEGKFEFKAQAVSPIYDAEGKAVVTANQTIYIGGEGPDKGTPKSFDVNKIVTSAKYVAGDNVGDSYNVFQVWKPVGKVPATFKSKYVAEGKNYSSTTAETMPQNSWGSGSSTIDNGQLVMDNSGEFITIPTTNANILRGFGLKDEEILTVQNKETALYLTKPMLDTAYAAWGKYYDEYGDAVFTKTAKGSDDKQYTIYFASYNAYAGTGHKLTKDAFLNTTTGVPAYDLTAIFGTNHQTKWPNIESETDLANKLGTEIIPIDEANAVNAYKSVMGNFKTATEEIDTPEVPAGFDKVKRAEQIKSVKVAFEDPTYAAKFVTPTDTITDPYEGSSSYTISVDDNAKFEAGLTSVTLPAYIEIADNWGMTMKLPFTVTVKSATK